MEKGEPGRRKGVFGLAMLFWFSKRGLIGNRGMGAGTALLHQVGDGTLGSLGTAHSRAPSFLGRF